MVRKAIPKLNRTDADNPEWTADDFARAKPAKDVLTKTIYEAAKRYRGERGPQNSPVKKSVTVRLDPDIINYYKAGGRGWQGRMNADLRQKIEHNPPA